MNQTMSSFQHRALVSGIEETNPATAQDLKSVVARFKTETKTEASDSSTQRSSPISALSARLYLSEDGVHTARTTADRIHTHGTASTLRSNHGSMVVPQAWGYQIYEAEDEAEQGNALGSLQDMIEYG